MNVALAPERLSAIEAMSARLAHRGPDSHGVFKRAHLALAIRRLSIIDLETGDQPVANEAGDVTLVFNGEIYNYRELRRELDARGHQFKTRSDGEVIAHLYEERGDDFLQALNGMFAIALWDDRRRRLVLARDRAGEKPLFYSQAGETLVFASELKALLEYPGIRRELDPTSLSQYFFYGYVPGPRSIWKEIKRLPPGAQMTVEAGKVRIERYWRLKTFLRRPGQPGIAKSDEAGVIVDLRNRLREAVASRLVSDVPLGAFLSGGLDSSTLVALMSELAPGRVRTFSVSFAEKSFDEEPFAALVAQRFRTQHEVLRVDHRLLREGFDALAASLDEPLADPAVIPTFLLSRFARQDIKVALSGEGSDEIFGGYPTYLGERLARHYLRLPAFLRHFIMTSAGAILPASSGAVPVGAFLERFLRHAGKDPALRHLTWFGVLPPEELCQLFLREPRPTNLLETLLQPLQEPLSGVAFEDDVACGLYLDFLLYLPDDLLVKIDRASMAVSLELRAPFLDHRLVEFAAGLPAGLKVRRMQLKSLLKRAVAPWLPKEIVHRQKRGFSVPIARWLRNEMRPLVNDLLSESRLRNEGLFNPAYVRRMIDEHQSGRRDHRKPLWALVCFETWRNEWSRA